MRTYATGKDQRSSHKNRHVWGKITLKQAHISMFISVKDTILTTHAYKYAIKSLSQHF